MRRLTREWLDDYVRNDAVLAWLDAADVDIAQGMVCDRWLRESPVKRCIFHHMYADLLERRSRCRVLDVGGGLTRLTPFLASAHDYILSELLAHDASDAAETIERRIGRQFVVRGDWMELEADKYDLVIANDLFPNVDQRLDTFLEMFLPKCHRMRLSLTWHETRRHYRVRRLDADEIMCMAAWDSVQLGLVLRKHEHRIVGAEFAALSGPSQGLFANGRQVCLVELCGGLPSAGG